MRRTSILVSIFCMFSAFSLIGMQKINHNYNLLYIMWALFQGDFKTMLPVDVRKKILEKDIQQQIRHCNALIREIHTIDLSLAEVFFCSKRQLDGIAVLNAARAGRIYDQNWKLTTTCHISRGDYDKARTVPEGIKKKFKRGNGRWNNDFARLPVWVGQSRKAQKKTLSL